MGRVALINNLHVDHLGFYYIAAIARREGWDRRMFLTGRSTAGEVRRFDPDVVCFTATTGNHGWVVDLARELRADLPRARFVLGGPHPTYYPEVIRTGAFDAIVRGEGEDTLAEMLARIERTGDLADLPGAWVRQDGRIFENPLREAPQDLDALPFADRSIYDAYPWLQAHRYPMMISSRGCPFHCTFCYSPTAMDMFKGRGRFVRFRSVDNVIAEALELKRRHGPQTVEFVDDIFGMKRPWLREFSAKWREHVDIRFNMCIRADLLDEESVDLLAGAGCNVVQVGLEAGNDRVRNEVLRKELPRQQLFRAAELLRRHGIRFTLLNILGSPGETVEDCLETLQLNQQLRPNYAQAGLLVPFPRTGIYATAVAAGQIEADVPIERFAFSFFQSSPSLREDLGGLLNLQRVFAAAVRFPVLTPLARALARRREIPPLIAVFFAMHAWYYVVTKRIHWRYMMRLGMALKDVLRRSRLGLGGQLLPQRSTGMPRQPPSPAPEGG